MSSNNNNNNNNTAAVAAIEPNAMFSALTRRETTAAAALAAEDHATNPWTDPPRARSANYFNIRAIARELPAAATRSDFLDLYHNHQIIILTGDTGSGKTTQVPQFILYDDLPSPPRKIVCTQPRRVAAMGVAQRVAVELDVELGREVGYIFRNEDMTGPRTLLSYTTDGHLLVELKNDRLMGDYSCIIIDEAHERTVSTDLLMAELKQVCKRRRDLRLIIMSATMNAEKFQQYFEDAPLHHIPGRTYPVQVSHLADERFMFGSKTAPGTLADYVVAAMRTVIRIHMTEELGDILVFMPGQEDINVAVAGLRKDTARLEVYPLYANMSKARQRMALGPANNNQEGNVRRCIVATNIAETSLTIDGIVYVVDCGLEKTMMYNPRLRMDLLQVAPTSRASATQRMGRAGRTRPGKCFRLYSEHAFNNLLVKSPLPEIQRCDMSGPILDLLVLRRDPKVEELINFPYLDAPTPEVMLAAEVPLEPRHAIAFLHAMTDYPRPVWEVAAIVALLDEDGIQLRTGPAASLADLVHARFMDPHGDHLTLLNIWEAYTFQSATVCARMSRQDRSEHLYRWCQEHYLNYEGLQAAERAFQSLLAFAKREMRLPANHQFKPAPRQNWNDPEFSVIIRKALLKSGFLKIAVRDPNTDGYRTLGENQSGLVAPGSAMVKGEYEFIMYDGFIRTGLPYFTTVSGIDRRWLFEDPLSRAYVDSLLTKYLNKSEKWLPIRQLQAAKNRFDRATGGDGNAE
ncbi:hypothetical protein VPNG_06221 [Cytospora leucostoma]|uniref:RNA helicase n=1 Tax=Cytospora leucostoma TaxID=1230097 RepID=A0A423WYH9_9PEZI|nr:hypothetical protein VPNG_06221 [Cytospora leucostoma]